MTTESKPLTRRDSGKARVDWGAVARLAIFAAVAATVVGVTRSCTRERIADNVAREALRQLAAILPPGLYDNEPPRDVTYVSAPEVTSGLGPQPVYRARLKGQPVAAVLSVIAPDGYVGSIRLLVSVGIDGRIIGVRVAEHGETPGIGDAIEARKSGWILGFAGRSADNPPSTWRVRKDGGDIDQITGATITSRAVVAATARAVQYFASHRDEIFVPTADAAPAKSADETR